MNLCVRYSGRFDGGITVSALAGQSVHLFGANSFERDNAFQTGRDSGLDQDLSDYVAALSVNSDLGLLLNGAVRLDQEDWSANRVEGQVVGLVGPLTTMFTYAYIRSQPDFGINEDRSEVQAAASWQIDEHWRLFGASRYDIGNDTFVRHALGFGYDDEAFSASISYSEDKTRATGEPIDRTIYFRLGLRTLGSTSASANLLP
jgi:LPS-assembly protein